MSFSRQFVPLYNEKYLYNSSNDQKYNRGRYPEFLYDQKYNRGRYPEFFWCHKLILVRILLKRYKKEHEME